MDDDAAGVAALIDVAVAAAVAKASNGTGCFNVSIDPNLFLASSNAMSLSFSGRALIERANFSKRLIIFLLEFGLGCSTTGGKTGGSVGV